MQDKNTVQLRVQVIDLHPRVLDLQLPTYIPASDLTHRIARDAGLQAYWPNGLRRTYGLRARGRMMHNLETFDHLGIIDNELVYLLPQPPDGMGIVEQDPDYPITHSYTGQGLMAVISTILLTFIWVAGWGMALTQSQHWLVSTLPGLGLGVLCVAFARHSFGGRANRIRVLLLALGLGFVSLIPTLLLVPRITSLPFTVFLVNIIPGVLAAVASVLLSWVAWWGPVEPLAKKPKQHEIHIQEQEQRTCEICGLHVEEHVLESCVHQCGRVFHLGCYQARLAIYRGPPGFCQVCSKKIF